MGIDPKELVVRTIKDFKTGNEKTDLEKKLLDQKVTHTEEKRKEKLNIVVKERMNIIDEEKKGLWAPGDQNSKQF